MQRTSVSIKMILLAYTVQRVFKLGSQEYGESYSPKLFQLTYQNLVYLSRNGAQILKIIQYKTLTNTFRNIPTFCPVLVSLIIIYVLRGSDGHAQSHLHAPRCSQDDLGHVTPVNYALQILPSRHSAKSPRHSQRHPRVMAMETGQMWSYQVFKSVRSRL